MRTDVKLGERKEPLYSTYYADIATLRTHIYTSVCLPNRTNTARALLDRLM